MRRIERQGSLHSVDALQLKIAKRQEGALERVRHAEGSPRRRIVGVMLDRLLEQVDGPLDRLVRRHPNIHHAVRIRLVGFHRLGVTLLDPSNRRVVELQVEALAQLVDDLVLEFEDLIGLAVDLHGLE